MLTRELVDFVHCTVTDIVVCSAANLLAMTFSFPKVYPILDASVIPAEGRAEFLRRLGGELTAAGVTLLEYRNKTGSDGELLADATFLRAAMPAGIVKLILDDRADLVDRVGFDGVHVDAGDVPPAEARRIVGPGSNCRDFWRQRFAAARHPGRAGGLSGDRPGVHDDHQADSKAPIGPEGVKQASRRKRGRIGC